MKLRPIHNKLIVRVDREAEERSAGGIILEATEKARMARREGVVEALGTLCFSDMGDGESLVKVGEKVIFAKYAGTELGKNDKGEELRALNDIDIIAVRED